MPDLFGGDPIPLNRGPDFDMASWRAKHGPEQVEPIVDATLEELRNVYHSKRIGGVGYCYGGRYVVHYLRPDQGKLDVGYSAHPSYVEEESLAAIKGPFSIAAAETDTIFTAEKRHQSEKILQETGVPYQITLYSGVAHGFGVRGDPKNKTTRYAKEAAFLQAVQWFDEYLKE